MLIISLAFAPLSNKLLAQCPFSITAGSNVGVPNLSTAQSLSLLTVINDEIANQDFCIDGTFLVDYSTGSLTFNSCDIEVLNSSAFNFDSNFGFVDYILESCSIQGNFNTAMIFMGGNNKVVSSSLIDINNFVQNGGWITIASSYNENIMFNTIGGATSLSFSHFEDCFWEANGLIHFVNSINIFNRQTSTTQLPAIFLKGFGNYFGNENQFLNYETSINKLFSNPSPFVGITESESTFSGNGNIQPAIIIGQDIGTCPDFRINFRLFL